MAWASRGTLWAFLCSVDAFPLVVGGFSSVVLSFQQNTLAYAICRLFTVWGSTSGFCLPLLRFLLNFSRQLDWMRFWIIPMPVYTHTHSLSHTGSPHSAIACPCHAFVFNRHAHSLRHFVSICYQIVGMYAGFFRRKSLLPCAENKYSTT